MLKEVDRKGKGESVKDGEGREVVRGGGGEGRGGMEMGGRMVGKSGEKMGREKNKTKTTAARSIFHILLKFMLKDLQTIQEHNKAS